jgi:hypothetical protein
MDKAQTLQARSYQYHSPSLSHVKQHGSESAEERANIPEQIIGGGNGSEKKRKGDDNSKTEKITHITQIRHNLPYPRLVQARERPPILPQEPRKVT